jgi:hypothetical protein
MKVRTWLLYLVVFGFGWWLIDGLVFGRLWNIWSVLWALLATALIPGVTWLRVHRYLKRSKPS